MTNHPLPPGIPVGRDDATVLPVASGDDPSAYLMDGRYRVERMIGEGAFGRVYLAFDVRLRRNVAIKQLLACRNKDDADVYDRYLERFQREARAAGVVQHPNIVAVLELAIDSDKNHYLVMEYVDGTNLRDLLAQVGTLPVERAVQVATEMARALEAVHERDIVHRDLKPANIMLTRRGVTKVTDFGIAQVGHESMRTGFASGHPGTPIYMSPEQRSGSDYLDGRSDLYSLGLVLYEMLVGEPYARRERPLDAVRPDLSPQLIAIFKRLTAKERGNRYPTATEAVAALTRLVSLQQASPTIGSPAPTLPDGGPAPVARSETRASASHTGTPPSLSPANEKASDSLQAGFLTASPSSASPSSVGVSQSGDRAPEVVSASGKGRRGVFFGICGAVVAVGVLLAALATIGGGRTGGAPQTQTAGATLAPSPQEFRPTPGVIEPEAVATSVATATRPAPTATFAPTPTQAAPTIRPTPADGNGTDLSQWVTSEVAGLYRRSFVPATGEYHVTLLKENVIQPILSPDTQSIADLTLEVDVRLVAGPDAGGFGITFRVQPITPGEKARAAYVFVIDGQQRYALYQMNGDGTSIFIQRFTALPSGTMRTGPDAVNHLVATCRGDMITLAVNGTTLNTYPATITRPGTFGIAIETPTAVSGVEVAFRNLLVSPA